VFKCLSSACKLQIFDRGVFCGAVAAVQGEEQWGENAPLGGASAEYAGAG